MKVIPKKNQILGRTVDVVRTTGGLELPATQNNATTFALIEAVGPDVHDPSYVPGAIVLPHHFNHVYVRGGYHRIIFSADEILGVVEGLTEDQIDVAGGSSSGNGRSEVRGAPV